MGEPAAELADRDDAQEDEADDEHDEDDVSTLLGCRLLRREKEGARELGHRVRILMNARCVERECPSSQASARRRFGEAEKPCRVAAVAERRPCLLEPLVRSSEERHRPRPGGAVPRPPLGTKLRAQGKELGEIGDDVHLSDRGDPDESMGVEVVAEEDGDVAVGRREEAGPAVMEEITLVNGLEPDGEPFVTKRRENQRLLALSPRPEGGAPERALPLGLAGDGLPERKARNRGPQRRPPP
jgi:hypothetical protein